MIWENMMHLRMMIAENGFKRNIALTSMGWAVLTVWECEIKKDFDATMIRLESQILSNLE